MARLNREMANLRRLLERDQLGPILQKLGGGGSSNAMLSSGTDTGVCLHLGADRISLEFCERCEQKNRSQGGGPSTSQGAALKEEFPDLGSSNFDILEYLNAP